MSASLAYFVANYSFMAISIVFTLRLLELAEKSHLAVLYLLASVVDIVIALLLIYISWVFASAATDAIFISLLDDFTLREDFPVRAYFADGLKQLLATMSNEREASLASVVLVYSSALPTLAHLLLTSFFVVCVYVPGRMKDLGLGLLGSIYSEEKSVLRTLASLLMLASGLVGLVAVLATDPG